MKHFSYNYWFLIGTMLIFVVSCSNNPYKSVTYVDVGNEPVELISAFDDLSKGRLYKAKVEVLKNYLSGLLIIKKIDESHRIVFTSETGLKFFDFEFAPDTFIVHHVMQQFDNKFVLNTLKEDMGDLVLYNSNNYKIDQVSLKNTQQTIFLKQENNDWVYYFYEGNKLKKIERRGKKKQKVEISFQNYEDGLPQLINIAHNDFKMNIELNYIKR